MKQFFTGKYKTYVIIKLVMMNVCPTGDLTDAKNIDTLGSRQYEDEWKLYRNTLDKFNVAKKTIWLDVRGNHGKPNLLVL